MRKRLMALVAFLTSFLLPIIGLAQDQGKDADKAAEGGVPDWVMDIWNAVWPYAEPILLPDLEWEYGWLWYITFPLSIVWAMWSSEKMKKRCNDFGGVVAFGVPALVILFAFYGTVAYIVVKIFRLIMSVLGFGLAPSFWDLGTLIATLFGLIPLFLILLVLKLAKADWFVTKVLGYASKGAAWIWSKRVIAFNGPNLFWQVIGAGVIVYALNGGFAMHLTKDIAFSGLIPLVSGAVGLVYAAKTRLGRKLGAGIGRKAAKFKGKPLPDDHPTHAGWWPCIHVTQPEKGWPYYIPMLDQNAEPIMGADGKPRRDPHKVCQGPQGKDENGKPYNGLNPPWVTECLSWTCDGKNPFWQVCQDPKCGYKGLKGWGFRREPNVPAPCPKCGHMHPRVEVDGSFHTPDQDQSHVHNTAPAPVVTPPVAPPTNTPPEVTPPGGTPPGGTPPTATAESAGQWSICPACEKAVYLCKTPQYCKGCGTCLREPVSNLPADALEVRTPSLRDLMWRTS